jgi:hypothetical protein
MMVVAPDREEALRLARGAVLPVFTPYPPFDYQLGAGELHHVRLARLPATAKARAYRFEEDAPDYVTDWWCRFNWQDYTYTRGDYREECGCVCLYCLPHRRQDPRNVRLLTIPPACGIMRA